jgi:hypothetical protein
MLMRSHSGGKRIPRTLALLLALIAALAFVPPIGNAQKSVKKLTEQDVIDLLTGDVSSADVAAEAQKSGISFQVTTAVANRIRAAGGTEDLIRVLRTLAPHTTGTPVSTPHTGPGASPPTLLIESNPGQSQVYVDDEPVGTTSKEGRLKLTRIPPGSHGVRVSLSGYQDFEQTVTLTGGQVTTVAATLQPGGAPVAVTPVTPPVSPQPEEPEVVNPSQPGYLGILPAEQQPVGARGVVISGVQSGGPAAQAGIKAYDTILAVNGRAVTTPQDLRAALASHQAGQVVQITWYNGTKTVTQPIRLTNFPTGGQTTTQNTTQTILPPSLLNLPHNGLVNFTAAHDHGQSGKEYCVGIMSIGNGMISYKGAKGTNGVHNFEIPLKTVKEARRNAVYLVAIGAFHIKTRKGTNYNFVVINAQGQYQPPDSILEAIDTARGK